MLVMIVMRAGNESMSNIIFYTSHCAYPLVLQSQPLSSILSTGNSRDIDSWLLTDVYLELGGKCVRMHELILLSSTSCNAEYSRMCSVYTYMPIHSLSTHES